MHADDRDNKSYNVGGELKWARVLKSSDIEEHMSVFFTQRDAPSPRPEGYENDGRVVSRDVYRCAAVVPVRHSCRVEHIKAAYTGRQS